MLVFSKNAVLPKRAAYFHALHQHRKMTPFLIKTYKIEAPGLPPRLDLNGGGPNISPNIRIQSSQIGILRMPQHAPNFPPRLPWSPEGILVSPPIPADTPQAILDMIKSELPYIHRLRERDANIPTYIPVHTYTHTYTHTHKHTYRHVTCIQTYMHTYSP